MSTEEAPVVLAEGRYLLDRKLGRGGVGEVFLAHDRQLDRWVAIKRLLSDSAEAAERGENALREAKQLAALHHPNIVSVFDVVRNGEDVAVVMEYVHGHTLEEVSAAGPLGIEEFRDLARQSLDGIEAAHAAGLVHRDIKASNIMLAQNPGGGFRVKILDFGLAKVQSAPSLQTVDQTGSMMGSIFTMSPEQLEQMPVDCRTDLYALGCVFYQILAGSPPFDGNSVPTIIAGHLQHRFRPLHEARPDLPVGLCAWVERLFERDPEDRPASAAAARAELDGALAVAPVPGPLPGGARQVGSTPRLAVSAGTSTPPRTPPRRSALPLVATALGLLICIGAAWFWFASRGENTSNAPAAARPAEAAPPARETVAASKVYSPTDRAGLLDALGKDVEVRGVIGRTGVNKSNTIRFLNFAGTRREDVSLVFFLRPGESVFTADALNALVGKEVAVRGRLSEYNGDPQIEIADFAQIEVVP